MHLQLLGEFYDERILGRSKGDEYLGTILVNMKGTNLNEYLLKITETD